MIFFYSLNFSDQPCVDIGNRWPNFPGRSLGISRTSWEAIVCVFLTRIDWQQRIGVEEKPGETRRGGRVDSVDGKPSTISWGLARRRGGGAHCPSPLAFYGKWVTPPPWSASLSSFSPACRFSRTHDCSFAQSSRVFALADSFIGISLPPSLIPPPLVCPFIFRIFRSLFFTAVDFLLPCKIQSANIGCSILAMQRISVNESKRSRKRKIPLAVAPLE